MLFLTRFTTCRYVLYGRWIIHFKRFDSDKLSTSFFFLLLGFYIFLFAAYIGVRFAWHGFDGDAIRLTALSQNVLTEGTLSPRQGGYPYGYLYGSLNVYLAYLTGLSILVLQTVIQPFLIVLLIPVAFTAYRSVVSRVEIAGLAALFLFLSPEFLYEATRSSHAKITYLLALTMLWILAQSFRSDLTPRRLVSWILLFYIVAYALISSNSFFASSYIFAIAFGFIATHILLALNWTREGVSPRLRRLSFVTVSSLLLVFLFIFYLYPPALNQVGTLRSVWDKISAFFLSFEPTRGANPYAYVQQTWISMWVYLTLTLFNWLMLFLSFAVWLHMAWRLLIRREKLSAQELLLWLLYASFAGMLFTSVIIDRTGALSSNLQLRLFPHLMLVSVPLAAAGVMALLFWLRRHSRPCIRQAASVALVMSILFFAFGAMFKVTNEPLLSNWWSFYADSERQAFVWMGDRIQFNRVWMGRDARLRMLADAYEEQWRKQGVWVGVRDPKKTRYILISEISRMRSISVSDILPDIRPFQRIYDTGDVHLYYSRSKTPYQR